MRSARLPCAALLAAVVTPALAQPAASRAWRPEERTLVTDLSFVTAVAATQLVVYAATREALAVYDRGTGALREIVGTIDGYPGGPVTAMVADPGDDTAWLGGSGFWAEYEPLGRRIEAGPLPALADQAVLDQSDPSRGAYFHTAAGWFFVRRGGIAAEPARDTPPPGRRIAALAAQELLGRAPAFDLVRGRIERDDMLRTWRMTSAVMTPARNEAFVGTDGNGVFRVDLDTYAAERLPAGLLAAPSEAVAVVGGVVCAGSDERYRALRRGISCFPPDLGEFTYYEGATLAGLPGGGARRLLVTRRALWAATGQGLLRVDRSSGAARQLGVRDGLPSDDVRALARAPEGVWVGTARGLAVVPDTGATAHATMSLALDAPVLALAAREDTLWVGTTVGLFVLLPGAQAPIPASPGRPELSSPVVALALEGDTLLVATDTRLAWRAGDMWHMLAPPAPSVGQVTALAADPGGFWVAGTGGLGFFQPVRNVWRALTAPGDVPQPVSDVVAAGDYVWAASPAGVVRLERRILGP